MPLRSFWAILIGAFTTFCVYGYQFGHSNHTVYLLDALRINDPSILQNDWFTTSTLQYHFLFSRFAALLLRSNLIEPVFLVAYALLVVAFHIALYGIVRHFGGDDAAYLLAVAFHYLFAAGTGLGMYQFFQDSAFLPSNIANVALLWGIWKWLDNRPIVSGIGFGLAGLFHLNHALVGSALWIGLCLWTGIKKAERRQLLVGSICALLPSLINIGLAACAALSRSGALPLREFVDLYVHLRHPHHYDPSTWPIGIWICFFYPLALGLWLIRGRARRVLLLLLVPLAVAILGAGITYVSETLVQMSLYRFSIYVQLLGFAAAAVAIRSAIGAPTTSALGLATCVAISLACLYLGPFFGVFTMPGEDPRYLALCEQIRRETPADAVFLVPPDEESMRLIGRRAIVVNFKHVPQLSAELGNWRQRLCDVLAMDDLSTLPRGFKPTLSAIAQRYDSLSLEQHIAVAKKYGARYVIHRDGTGAPLLYDVQP